MVVCSSMYVVVTNNCFVFVFVCLFVLFVLLFTDDGEHFVLTALTQNCIVVSS